MMTTLLVSNLAQFVTRCSGGIVCPVRSLLLVDLVDEAIVFEPFTPALAIAVAKRVRPGGRIVWER